MAACWVGGPVARAATDPTAGDGTAIAAKDGAWSAGSGTLKAASFLANASPSLAPPPPVAVWAEAPLARSPTAAAGIVVSAPPPAIGIAAPEERSKSAELCGGAGASDAACPTGRGSGAGVGCAIGIEPPPSSSAGVVAPEGNGGMGVTGMVGADDNGESIIGPLAVAAGNIIIIIGPFGPIRPPTACATMPGGAPSGPITPPGGTPISLSSRGGIMPICSPSRPPAPNDAGGYTTARRKCRGGGDSVTAGGDDDPRARVKDRHP